MNKLQIYFLLSLLLCLGSTADDKGTLGIYVSPHGITRQNQVHIALQLIEKNITIQQTKYQHGNINYTLSNATVSVLFLDSKQSIEITGNNSIKVSGGTIEFSYAFNYSKVENSHSTQGWAYGSVVSESFNYTKQLFYLDDGHLHWTLVSGESAYTNLSIGKRMTIKRMQPYNQTDYENILVMLDRDINLTTPANVEIQLLNQFNNYMPKSLNQTLHSNILQIEIPYKFHSPTHGQIGMTIQNHIWDFGVDPEDGYKLVYLSSIKGQPEPCTGQLVPTRHQSFSTYGGHQTIHLNCLYTSILIYLQKNGWLDIKLNNDWDCNAFQFYAGDLFDLINNLYLKVNPREFLEGDCKVGTNGLSIKHTPQERYNIYSVKAIYTCSLHSRDKASQTIDILKFTADAKLSIKAESTKTEFNFEIDDADILNIEFQSVGDFYVSNKNLAEFKTTQILNKLKKTKVFGTGFPAIPRQLPKTEVKSGYVIYYDSHSIEESAENLMMM